MIDVILYSTGCPRCNVLKKKLNDKGINFSENNSVEEMLSMGIMEAPMLRVGGELLDFTKAVIWVNAR